MYVKILGIIITLTSSTLLGLYFSKSLTYRLEELHTLKKLLIMLRGDVKYGMTPLPEALEELSNRSVAPFKEFFNEVSKELKKFNGNNLQLIWNSSIEKHLKSSFLKKEDLTKLMQLGDTLGYLDKEMQLNTIDLYLEQLEEEIKYLTNNNGQSQKLYKNLGVLGGLLAAIVFI
ncbi:stage III sporulation protein AB [Natranaerovirga pectinivora]|uniref:Stage III sporulation protein AB n=1 Tax=Natranaerovirga pectinivora TaxID=682400 RepID=A0A4R3MPX6_9FIRM|nr:stage III sporulation protein AB [Natranaerovirga pectinivora]TCT16912.1 stage III sporulation protein AB [Natranaerovirga pectinivora]